MKTLLVILLMLSVIPAYGYVIEFKVETECYNNSIPISSFSMFLYTLPYGVDISDNTGLTHGRIDVLSMDLLWNSVLRLDVSYREVITKNIVINVRGELNEENIASPGAVAGPYDLFSASYSHMGEGGVDLKGVLP